MKISVRIVAVVFGVWSLSIAHGALAQNNAVSEALRGAIQRLRTDGKLRVGGASVAAVHVIPELYKQRGYEPAWSGERIEHLIDAIKDTRRDGLSPADYHLPALQSLRSDIVAGQKAAPENLAALDLLLTDSLARLSYHVLFGKIDPKNIDRDWNLDRKFNGEGPVQFLARLIASPNLDGEIEDLKPEQPYYRRLRRALSLYRVIEAKGGWDRIPSGKTLKLGMTGARIEGLRERLLMTGDLESAPEARLDAFDRGVHEAVVEFQSRHGLEADGIVGKSTLAALNVPVATRIDQIRLNLERGRWVLQDLEDDFIVVNIAGFEAFLVRGGREIWRTRAQVGKPYRKTPVMKSRMTYLELNPTWTVPPTILAKDILPAVKRNPNYLASKDLQVLTRSGKPVNPRSVNWGSYTARNFPYLLRQPPGPKNALGRVKFMFPNPHLVYLHDTPSKNLFARADRSFSSGCIRIENPFELAELVLQGSGRWDRKAIDKAVESKRTRTVRLSKPLPVLLLYWTAYVDEEGRVIFLKDIYGRDAPVLKRLNGPFRISRRGIDSSLPDKAR